MSDIAYRLNLFIEHAGLKQKDIADALGISAAAVSKICSGKNSPSSQSISLICQKFGVSEEWLRTGEGQMIVPLSEDEELEEWIGQLQMDLVHGDRVAFIKRNLLLAMKRTFKSDQTWLDIAAFIEEVAKMCQEDSEK